MIVRMGYDFAMTIGSDESKATPLSKGQELHSGRAATAGGEASISTPPVGLHSGKE